jgi:AbrB family looped-hinge helix DNA binding protein
MMLIAKVITRGRITVPKEVRGHLNLKGGDKIELVVNRSGGVDFKPINRSPKSSRRYRSPLA